MSAFSQLTGLSIGQLLDEFIFKVRNLRVHAKPHGRSLVNGIEQMPAPGLREVGVPRLAPDKGEKCTKRCLKRFMKPLP